ncbi:LON peptidase substrate-binding domain-containing protein [Pirellulales bacterium]|nr:LON peptidase substrate-binding domain-containing protein [Pirellulales bacterium]
MSMLPWNAEDLTFDESRFRGTARLFPLPDLVMYPHVVQPLHIFESRYCEMLNESLDSDGLLTMCMLSEGWEEDYDSRPEIHPFGCLGKVITHRRLDDGTYNLMLLGQRRVRIVEELPPYRSFREARVELLEELYPACGEEDRPELQADLLAAFQVALPGELAPNASISELLSSQAPLGVLTDLVGFALPLAPGLKRNLLRECNVDLRAKMLLEAITSEAPQAPEPPRDPWQTLPFSQN